MVKFSAVAPDQFGQDRAIVGVAPVDRRRGDDAGFDAAAQVDLDPILAAPLAAVLLVEPADEFGDAEAAGIHREVGVHGAERQAASDDEVVKVRRDIRRFEDDVDLVRAEVGGQEPRPWASARSDPKRRLENVV